MANTKRRSTAKPVKPVKKGGSSLAATIKSELAKPVIPGQVLFAAGDIEAAKTLGIPLDLIARSFVEPAARAACCPAAHPAALQRLERALQQGVEVERRLQEGGRPELQLSRKALHLGFDRPRTDIEHLNVAIPFVEHRETDEDILGIREVISEDRLYVIEQLREARAAIGYGATGRVRDGPEGDHLSPRKTNRCKNDYRTLR